IGHGFTSLIGTYPKDVFFDPTQNFSWSVFLIGVVSIVAGLVAFALTRFSFILFTVVLGISLTVQLLIPGIHHHPSADDHLVAAIVLGAVHVLMGLMLDAGGRRRDAFWFHVGGFTNVAVGLAYYSAAPSGNSERSWIPMFIAGAVVLVCSAPLWRGTWAAYWLLCFYAPILHWLTIVLTADTAGRTTRAARSAARRSPPPRRPRPGRLRRPSRPRPLDPVTRRARRHRAARARFAALPRRRHRGTCARRPHTR